jgi:hypothetical protein
VYANSPFHEITADIHLSTDVTRTSPVRTGEFVFYVIPYTGICQHPLHDPISQRETRERRHVLRRRNRQTVRLAYSILKSSYIAA